MKRLPVNLATTPVEHRQWLRRVTLSGAIVVVVITAVQVLFASTLDELPDTTASEAEAVELLRGWSDEVADMTGAADPRSARNLAISVGLGNALIDQRALPWASLFTLLEDSLPEDVRLDMIQPVATVDGVRVTLSAASASGDALLEFLAALERRPEFVAVYPGRQSLGLDGDLRLSIEALAAVRTSEPGQ